MFEKFSLCNRDNRKRERERERERERTFVMILDTLCWCTSFNENVTENGRGLLP